MGARRERRIDKRPVLCELDLVYANPAIVSPVAQPICAAARRLLFGAGNLDACRIKITKGGIRALPHMSRFPYAIYCIFRTQAHNGADAKYLTVFARHVYSP